MMLSILANQQVEKDIYLPAPQQFERQLFAGTLTAFAYAGAFYTAQQFAVTFSRKP